MKWLCHTCLAKSSVLHISGAILVLLLFLTDPKPVWAALPTGFVDELVANLSAPTALAFTPDGRLLIAQQSGQLRIYQNGTLLANPALDLSAKVCNNVERGLLGIAIDPNFSANNYIYLFYTYDQAGNGTCQLSDPAPANPVNQVSRFTLSPNNVISAASEKVILSNIQSNWGNHNAGDLKFAADGYLYITTGDGGREKVPPREISNLNGKILRILLNSDGSYSFTGNPYSNNSDVRKCGDPSGLLSGSGACGEVFAHGLRNPFRFAFQPGSSEFYINDVGQGVWEEVNRGAIGADYGWNLREGFCTYPPLGCGNTPARISDPIYAYNHNTGCASITGGAFIPQGIWPTTYGGYIYSDYVCGKLFTLTTSQPYTASEMVNGLGANSAVTMIFGPYNSTQALYYTNYNNGGSVRRIYYTGATNQPPTAKISANPTNGGAPLTVNFDGSGSSDPEGSALTYHWAFGDGQISTNNNAATIQHTYASIGVYIAQLVVKDVAGNSSFSATMRIDAGNSAPVPVIIAPTDSDRFYVGQLVTLQGSANDQQDGTLPTTSLQWEVRQYHLDSRNPQNIHFHPYFSSTGNNLTFTAPDMEDLFAHNSHLEIRLTATDSQGLSATTIQEFRPSGGNREIQATFQTSPANLSVTINGTTYDTPSSFYMWERSVINVTVPSPQIANQIAQAFFSWSDGNAKTHTIVMPNSSTTYTANFVTITSTPTPVIPMPTKTPTATRSVTPTRSPTATPTPTANQSQAVIRISLDSIPDSPADMTFYSAFGSFLLDDPQQNDGDTYGKMVQFLASPGTYSITLGDRSGWRTAAISCLPATNATVTLATNSVSIVASQGTTVNCTFVTQAVTTPTTTVVATTKTPTPSATPRIPTLTPTPTLVHSSCTLFTNNATRPIGVGSGSIESTMVVTGSPPIADLNVALKMSHTYVGDLKITLRHVQSGKDVVLLDRPGSPPLRFGCKYDDIVAIFSDEASLPVENRCEPSIPTINGSFIPDQPLTVFDGISGEGNWILSIIDNDPFVDQGALTEWSLQLCQSGATQNDMRLPDNSVPLVSGRAAPLEQDKESQMENQLFLPLING